MDGEQRDVLSTHSKKQATSTLSDHGTDWFPDVGKLNSCGLVCCSNTRCSYMFVGLLVSLFCLYVRKEK